MNLSGSKGMKLVQRLDDKDALVVSKCLKNNINRITGKHTDPGGLTHFQFHQTSLIPTGLDVSYNNITDEGFRHFADLLRVRRVEE